MRIRTIAMASLTLLAGSTLPVTEAGAAYSYCMEPRAPSLFLTKPTKPYCAASRSCTEWEVSSYRREVESYYRDLEAYAADVDKYYKRAQEYVTCMADLS